jgi:SAM-dependent methyltransferase
MVIPDVVVRHIGTGVSYADGAEDDILRALASADDLTSGSDELAARIVDWPTRYHFSHQRTNLLRPLAIGQGTRVLDVGGGTGIVARYLGEQGADVVALEGNPDRARAAAVRCRELDGVEVLVGALDDLPADDLFDVVCLVGVLEYAGAAAGGAGGAPAMLARARAHLRPGGALVVAIENQLGLKYLLGAREDHVGRPWVGIEGYSGPPGVRTWSRRQLDQLLRASGLGHQRWLAPFPDYKLPAVVLHERLYAEPDAGELIDQLVLQPVICHDRPPVRLADAAAAHRTWIDAGLGLDVANSFLVVAGADEGGVDRLVPERLAWLFGGPRRARWRRDRVLTLTRDVVTRGDASPRRERWLAQDPGSSRPYVAGATLGHRALAAVRAHDRAELGRVLSRWRDELDRVAQPVADLEPDSHPFLLPDTTIGLPDGHLDASLSNFVESPGGDIAYVDDEWRTGQPIDVRVARYRALWVLGREIVTSGIDHLWGDTATVDDIVADLAALADVELDPRVADAWRAGEIDLQALVVGADREHLEAGWLDGSLRSVDLGPAAAAAGADPGAGSWPRGEEAEALATAFETQATELRQLRDQVEWLGEQRREFIGQRDHLEGVGEALRAEIESLRRPRSALAHAFGRRAWRQRAEGLRRRWAERREPEGAAGA